MHMFHELIGLLSNLFSFGMRQIEIVFYLILLESRKFIFNWFKTFAKKALEERLDNEANKLLKRLFTKKAAAEENKMESDEVVALKLAFAEEKIKRLEAELELERMKNNQPPQRGARILKRIK